MHTKIEQTTQDMKDIADGLASGVAPEKIETSITYGNQWLAEMKERGMNINAGLIKQWFLLLVY